MLNLLEMVPINSFSHRCPSRTPLSLSSAPLICFLLCSSAAATLPALRSAAPDENFVDDAPSSLLAVAASPPAARGRGGECCCTRAYVSSTGAPPPTRPPSTSPPAAVRRYHSAAAALRPPQLGRTARGSALGLRRTSRHHRSRQRGGGAGRSEATFRLSRARRREEGG
uniref:Uncharacterized protein n=1 Tax=Setaria viridis TaxID=4556 RepID=A0A4U6TCV6_SETVI|nr:hypothetical protein SEVIR_9G570501v2 [Setaria viridis]